MNTKAARREAISERLATLAGAIGVLETAIDATDQALQATSADDLAAAIHAQTEAASRTLELKHELLQSLPLRPQQDDLSSLHSLLRQHPDADVLLPQYEQIAQRLKTGKLKLSQQAQVVNKLQMINRQLFAVLTDADNQGYDHQGSCSDSDSARNIAQA